MKYISFRKQMVHSILKSGLVSFLIAAIAALVIILPFLEKSAVEQAQNSNNLMMQELESTLSYSENYNEFIAVALEQNKTIQNYLQYPESTGETKSAVILNNLTSYINMVRGIAVEGDGNVRVDSITNLTDDDYKIFETDHYRNIRESAFGRSFSPVYLTNVAYNQYYTVAYSRNYYQNNRWCTVVLFVNLNNMLNTLKSIASNHLDVYYLMDNSGHIFYSSENQREQETEQIFREELHNGEQLIKGNRVFVKTSVNNGYKVISIVRSSTIGKALLPYFIGLFLAMLLSLVLTIIFTTRNVNAMITPIIELSEHMLQAADGNLDCKVDTHRQDEIGQLETSFNKMIDDLKHNLEVIGEKEAKEQRIRFSLLISQIDPHFICNTINSISYLARKRRYEDIVKVNNALIVILRDRLRVNDIQITDTVENEKRVVEQYLEIEKFMYGGQLIVTWDLEEDLLEEQIPKNMIQPLVENSLFHGLIDEEEGELNGHLIIRLFRDSLDNIVLCVEDDGHGMGEEKLLELQRETMEEENRGFKIGLRNIMGRLHYLYPNMNCMEIQSRENEGTKIRITFYKTRI